MRKSIGLTQKAFAEVIGFTVHTVHCWEARKRLPTHPDEVVWHIRETVKSTIRSKSA